MRTRIRDCSRWNALLAGGLMCVAAAAGADPVASPSFAEVGREYTGFDSPAAARLALGDFDADGIHDFAFIGVTGVGSQALSVVGKKPDGTFGFKQQLLLPDLHVQRVLTLPQTSGAPHLLTVASDGQVREYAGWPLAQVQAFPSLPNVASAAVGDLFGDGVQRLALCTDSKVAVFDIAGALQWSIPIENCTDLLSYQLDASNAMELIVAGPKPGIVLDASNGTTRWSYPDSFGATTAAGKLGAHGETEFVTAGPQITVFSANPYSPLWDYSGGYYFSAGGLVVTDIDGDGRDDILFQSSNGGLQVLDSVTQTAKPLSTSAAVAPQALAVADIDGSGTQRLIGADNSSIYVIDETSGNVIWAATSSTLPFNVMALADIDGDGRSELLSAIGKEYWIGNAGLQARDFASGAIKWTDAANSGNANDPFFTAPFRLLVDTQLDPNTPKIISAGTAVYDGRILVVDGKTHAVDVQMGAYSSGGPLDSRVVYDAILADVDGDGVDDIVAASAPDLSWTYGSKLQAFSLLGEPLWESVGMDGYGINGVFVLPASLGAGDELVAVLPDGLRAYGRLSHLLDWTMDASNEGALLVVHGAAGAEIALEHDNVISFYDAATRAYLRQIALADNVDAATALNGDAHLLLVSSGGSMRLIDGITGAELASSPYLGDHLAAPNQLAVESAGPGAWRIGAGNRLGIFRYMLTLSDRVFAAGFETN